ncbi:prepilin-type N-terminal cleavage/methylation domain-containing protein [Roseimicrobium sp. ORNL1]|uniref:prepilin-type N-terminal cleavage/methylation domain-containing protein n=1 Tax=Roseimicrobium sp. ORNL1 TaxID=2711231 RepID=UPI0013E164A5|nr:prepilin-type N-terminal cleavage/methylation domain-containing protein [Roseimicrobium sp. ORNL1]QIF00277.1 prepilin-type N-terminal cleavage/methylation domain-containing protein [Roseimicrobium sp. ORNL1]
MNYRPPASERSRPGFSLPEVAIAIAVAGVALMAVVGLLPGLLNVDRGSGINSVISSLSTQVLGQLQSEPYQNPQSSPPARNFLFSENGQLVQNPAEAQYDCRVSFGAIPVSAGAGPEGTIANPGPNCSLVTMEFTWPVGSRSRLNRRVVHATLANN